MAAAAPRMAATVHQIERNLRPLPWVMHPRSILAAQVAAAAIGRFRFRRPCFFAQPQHTQHNHNGRQPAELCRILSVPRPNILRMSDNDSMVDGVVERSDANYFHAWKTLVSGGPDSEIHDDGSGLVVVSSGLPSVAVYNVAFVTKPLVDPQGAIEKSIKFFRDRNIPGLICVRDGVDGRVDDIARNCGLKLSSPHPGMVLPIPKESEREPADDLDISELQSDEDIDDFSQLADAAFGMPNGVARKLTTPWTIRQPGTKFFLGRVNGKAVATSVLIRTDKVAGIYYVTTDVNFRGRGFGQAMAWAAVQAGADDGCDMASLQASDLGRRVYERMGFRVVAPYNNYEVPVLESS